MADVEVYKSKGDEYCACCRKVGKGYTVVKAGIMKLPFCEECYPQFKASVNAGPTKEVIGI